MHNRYLSKVGMIYELSGRPQRSPIHIKLGKSSLTSVGARAVGSGWVGLYGRPLSCSGLSRSHRSDSQQRATIKAHPSTLHPPSPLRNSHLHFVRLMPLGRPLQSPIHLSICSTLQGFEVGGIDFALAELDELINGEVFHACVMQCLDVGRLDVVFVQFDDLFDREVVQSGFTEPADVGWFDLVFAQFYYRIKIEISQPGLANFDKVARLDVVFAQFDELINGEVGYADLA